MKRTRVIRIRPTLHVCKQIVKLGPLHFLTIGPGGPSGPGEPGSPCSPFKQTTVIQDFQSLPPNSVNLLYFAVSQNVS